MKVMLAWYSVQNFEAAKTFYGDVLGLKKTYEMQGWAEFSHAEGAVSIGISQAQAAANGKGGGATVVLGVENLTSTMTGLSAKGVSFVGEIMEIPGVVKIATFTDPEGNRLQLAQSLL